MANSVTRVGFGAGGVSSGGSARILVFSTPVEPAVERIHTVPGSVRGTVPIDLSDISAFQVTDGTLTIGTVSLLNIDTSASVDINAVVAVITTALQSNVALSGYVFSLSYISGIFYARVNNEDAAVEALSGTFAVAFGLTNPTLITSHRPPSPAIILPEPSQGGRWNELHFRVIGTSYALSSYYFECTFFDTGTELIASYIAFNNSSGWEVGDAIQVTGPIEIGLCIAYNVRYIAISYDPSTREITWANTSVIQPTRSNWIPNIRSLTVVGS